MLTLEAPELFSEDALRSIISYQIESATPKELAIIPKDHDLLTSFLRVEDILKLRTLPKEERDQRISDIVSLMKNAERLSIINPSSSDRLVKP